MKIKAWVTICLLWLGVLQIAHSATRCECGSHATGITAFTVGDGEDCCLNVPSATGQVYSYVQQENGVWELIDEDTIAGTVAQANCCT